MVPAHPLKPSAWMRPASAGVVCALLAGCSAPPPPPAAARNDALPQVVAVGDLHGDLGNALQALQLAGVVDGSGHWAGGDTTLVQTGDITDRGPDSKGLIELMQRLESEAPESGGRVVSLLGNHEAMNLTGDWRYVHPGDVAAFGGEQARREALSVQAPHGRWLASRPAVAKVEDTVFVHGGVRATWAERGIDVINREVRQALNPPVRQGRAANPRAAVLGPDGPLWFRGYVSEPEGVACPELERALSALQAKRMVVGHTTRRDGKIQTRCGGKLHVIDIGIATAYGGHVGSWRSHLGDAHALYPSGNVDLEDPA